jgi:hypothetical protein
MTTQIAAIKSEAKDSHGNITMELDTASLYMDGSGIERKIGAAIYKMDINTTQLQHLGSEIQYNVFAAELIMMYLSAKMAQNDAYKK